jgi:hypothetical protein
MEVISFLEDYAAQSVYIQPLFRFILQIFHDAGSDGDDDEEEKGLLSSAAILQWAEHRHKLSSDHPKARFVHDSKVMEFLEWLKDEEEGSDDDDDDEEDDGESEEES